MSTDITLIPKQVGEAVVWEAPPSEGGTGGGNGGGGNESPPPPDGNTPNPPSSKKRRKTKGLVIWLAIALVLAVVFETVHYNGYVKAEGFWGGFFSSFLWFGVIPTIILLVPLIQGARKLTSNIRERRKSEGKKGYEPLTNEKKSEEKPKAKKDDGWHFFPFWALMSVHWIGVLSVYTVTSLALYSFLKPSIVGGGEGLSENELRTLLFALVAIPFIYHWVNLVNGKKGPRPVAFAIGWFMSIAGFAALAIGAYKFF